MIILEETALGNRRGRKSGFTIVELQVCCVVIIVLSAIVGLNMRAVLANRILKNETQDLYFGLQRAKSEAIKRNAYVAFIINSVGYEIFVDNGAGGGIKGDWVCQSGEDRIIDHRFRKGVMYVGTTFPSNRVRFNGGLAVTGGSVTLANKRGRVMKIVMNIASRIRVENK